MGDPNKPLEVQRRSGSTSAALVTKQKLVMKPKGETKRKQFTGRCHSCIKTGHMLHECQWKKSGKPQVRIEDQKEKEKEKEKVNIAEERNGFAFIVANNKVLKMAKDFEPWIIDSATSDHYTSDETRIDSELTKFDGSVIAANDEQLEVTPIGRRLKYG